MNIKKNNLLITVALLTICSYVHSNKQKQHRYNIAWVCEEQQRQKFLDLSQELFNGNNCGYLLSEKSLPHISICQFETDNIDIVNTITKDLKYYTQNISPILTGLSLLPGSGEFQNDVWIELSVLREQKLAETQNTLIHMLRSHGINKLAILLGDPYRPHITLTKVNKTTSQLILDLNKFSQTLTALAQHDITFTIQLGIADDNWQFIEIIG